MGKELSKAGYRKTSHTLPKKFQMTPENFSTWDSLEEVFLSEAAELTPRNAECIKVNV